MKFESYAVYMRALVFYMNYLQARKEMEKTTKLMESLRLQPPAVIDMNYTSQTEETGLNYIPQRELKMDGETGLNYIPQRELNMDYDTTPTFNCRNCQSQDVEFDNTIDQVVCMGCGEQLHYNPIQLDYEVIE
jgi:hypothetical protein